MPNPIDTPDQRRIELEALKVYADPRVQATINNTQLNEVI